MDTVLYDPVDTEEGKVSLYDTTSIPKLMSPERAKTKAKKIDFTLGEDSPGVEEVTSELTNGMEERLKDRAMILEKAKSWQVRQGKISKLQESAHNQGKPLDDEEISAIENLMNDKELNEAIAFPETYFEKRYSQKMTRFAVESLMAGTELAFGEVPQIKAEGPDYDGLRDHTVKQELFRKLGEEYTERAGSEPLYRVLGDVGAHVVFPPYAWWANNNAVKNAPTSSILSGSNILEQVDYLHRIQDPEQAYREAKAAIEEIYSKSPIQARKFAQYLQSYSASDKATESLFNVVDVGLMVGPTALRAARNTLALRRALSTGASIPGIYDATGQVARAAFAEVRARVAARAAGNGALPNSLDDVLNEVDVIANPGAILNDVNNTGFSREFADRFETALTAQSAGLQRAGLVDPMNVTRITPGTAAYNTMMQETERLFRVQYPTVNSAILAIRPIRSAENTLTNTDHIAVQLGRKTGVLFDEAYEARAVAELWGLKGYTIGERGGKYYIEVTKAVDETLPSVRASLAIDTQNAPTPETFLGKFMGYLRTKDNLVSGDINQELKTATFGASQLNNVSQAIMARAFNNLPRWRSESRQNFMQYITMQRDIIDPVSGVRGRFDDTIGTFWANWSNHFGRAPTELEANAYFTYRQVSDNEYVMRNLLIYKGKTRLGFENFKFSMVTPGKNLPATGRERASIALPESQTSNLEGRLVDLERLFEHREGAPILVWDRYGQFLQFRTNQMSQADRAALDYLVQQRGYRVVQLSDFGTEALRTSGIAGIPTGNIRYVVVRDFESSPLSLHQLPYSPGGHVEYADNFFVSQPRINTYAYRGTEINDYLGDYTIYSARTAQEGRWIADIIENGRRMLNDRQALRTYLRDSGAPFSLSEFTQMFDATRGGILNPNTPVFARQRAANTFKEHKLDAHYPNMSDPFDNPHNPFNDDVNLKYAMERNENLNSFINYGTDNNPMYGLRPSRLVDPAATIERSLSNIARTRYLDDLKIKASERFVQEFGDLIKGDAVDIARYPVKYFSGDVLNKDTLDKARLATAMNYQRTLKEFFSIKHLEVRRSEAILHRAYEALRPQVGQHAAETHIDRWVDSWLAHTIDDPTRWIRQVAFYPRMGFYNPKQLFLQGLGVIHTGILEGAERAMNGAMAGSLMRPIHLSNMQGHLDHLANLSLNYGYRSVDDFKDSYNALQRSGFQNVGGEYGTLDDFLTPGIAFGGNGRRALDSSLVFFKMGERANRLTAWNASFMRWREANPIAVFNDAAAKEVLTRADFLTMNMTRASNASWNQGYASVISQFFSYHARLMDQFWGTALAPTVRERAVVRARMMGVYSLLYGVPLGTGGVALGALWPFHEQTKEYMIQNGYSADGTIMEPFINGVPQWALSFATGGEGPTVAETFGPNGLSFLKDVITGEKNVPELALGASANVFRDFGSGFFDLAKAGYLGAEPYLYGLMATGLSDDGKHYNVTGEEMMDALLKMAKPISVLTNAQKGFYALTLNKYTAKNGDTIVLDHSKMQAFMTGILGTNPEEVNDYYRKVGIKQGIDEFQRQPREEAIKWLRRSYDLDITDNERLAYQRKAATFKVLGDFTEQQWLAILRESARTYEVQMEELDNRLKRASKENYDRYLQGILKEGK